MGSNPGYLLKSFLFYQKAATLVNPTVFSRNLLLRLSRRRGKFGISYTSKNVLPIFSAYLIESVKSLVYILYFLAFFAWYETERYSLKVLMPIKFGRHGKGQLNSEWIYEVIVSPKMPTKNLKDFCPGSLLESRAEILQIFGWHFGRNDDLINSFWI